MIERIVPVSSPEVAEMSKLLENIYRAVNVGLVNELKIVCDAMEIDIWEVIEAASTKPFGFTPFILARGWVGTASPSTPIIWPGERGNSEFGRGLSNSRETSIEGCRTTW